jgi:virulence-associated protein VagC
MCIDLKEVPTMNTAKLFKNGSSQAVRFPKNIILKAMKYMLIK